MMNKIFDQLHLWFSLDSEPFLLTSMMCMFGAYMIRQIVKNVAVAVFFYPVLLTSSIAAIGIGTQHGLIGHWQSSIMHLLAAITVGMCTSTIVLLSIIAVYNRNAS
jgi:hypothetical protein